MMRIATVFLLAVMPMFAQGPAAQSPAKPEAESCPMHEQHMKKTQHDSEVEKHGDTAMGFPHNKTAHHFRLYSDGGVIEVVVNDGDDVGNVQAIRGHLAHVAKMFSDGDFSVPMFVHDRVPPGVPVMKRERLAISYGFEELPAGGRIRIQTSNAEARKAIHEFLRFQIEDHHSGDATEISE